MIKSLVFISLAAIEVDVKQRRTACGAAQKCVQLLVFAAEACGTAGVNRSSGGL